MSDPLLSQPAPAVDASTSTSTQPIRTVFTDGSQEWRVQGRLHRLDGPAWIGADGTQRWYVHGERHRLDGPAIIETNGTEEYFIDGQRHRANGPAIIRADGSEEWWINGSNIVSAHQKIAGLRRKALIFVTTTVGI